MAQTDAEAQWLLNTREAFKEMFGAYPNVDDERMLELRRIGKAEHQLLAIAGEHLIARMESQECNMEAPEPKPWAVPQAKALIDRYRNLYAKVYPHTCLHLTDKEIFDLYEAWVDKADVDAAVIVYQMALHDRVTPLEGVKETLAFVAACDLCATNVLKRIAADVDISHEEMEYQHARLSAHIGDIWTTLKNKPAEL